MAICRPCKGTGKGKPWPGSTIDPICPICGGSGEVPSNNSGEGSRYPRGTTVTKKTTYTTRRRY